MSTLAVVIPTTHRVDEVVGLTREVRATSPIPATFTIVDNGPRADEAAWATVEGQVVMRDVYLGSEQGFVLGLRMAPTADWYLLLDHDARLHEKCLVTLLAVAADQDTVYSANQGGDGLSWYRGEGKPIAPTDLATETVAIDLAPWSGLLLGPGAANVVRSQESGYFFGWDDYLACWRLGRAGFQIRGVTGAVIANERIGDDWLAPWRAYYHTRNHILFHRQTGIGSAAELVRLRAKSLYGAIVTGRFDRASAITRGLVDGMMNRSGPRMPPS